MGDNSRCAPPTKQDAAQKEAGMHSWLLIDKQRLRRTQHCGLLVSKSQYGSKNRIIVLLLLIVQPIVEARATTEIMQGAK